MPSVFFILGAPRSATTMYARILNTATNAQVFVEQSPKLRRESRMLFDGKLTDPIATLRGARSRAIAEINAKGIKYGDKNQCYLPFIPYLHKTFHCKFVLITRDPRDVVRSMLSFSMTRGAVYARAEDSEASEIVSPDIEPWDYSRIRPCPGDPIFKLWRKISLAEKCAWSWNAFYQVALENFTHIPRDDWSVVDASNSSSDQIRRLFNFLELEGFDHSLVDNMLSSRINSIESKTGASHVVPPFIEWLDEDQSVVIDYMSETMKYFGYI